VACASDLKTGSGAVSGTMRPDAKDEWRSRQSGPRENASVQKANSVSVFHFPTQAKTRLEWATRPSGKAVIFDQNGVFRAAWDLGREQIRGVVVNGKLC